METTVLTIEFLNELSDRHRLYVVREEEADLNHGDRRERILEELRDLVFRLRDAEQRQRA